MNIQITRPRSIILHSALALISILLFAVPQAKADDSACLSNGYIGSYITGHATEVDVEGTTAYIVSQGLVYIIDITNPASPELLNWIYISDGYDSSIILKAEGTKLFVGFEDLISFQSFLFIYDVSDPAAPSLISSTYGPGGCMRRFHIANQTLYIIRGCGVAMETVDISDLQNPTQSAFVLFPEENSNYKMRGSIAYIVNPDTGLSILDLSDPANPLPLGSIETTGTAYSFDVDGDAVYINVLQAGKLTGIQVIDVSNLESPERVGIIPLPVESFRGIRVEGDDLYVFLGSSVGFNVFDISDPALPTLKGIYDAQSRYWDIKIVDSTAYLASDLAGLQIVDVNDLPTESPFLGEFVVEQDRVEDVQVIGTTAYVADSFQGLEILDVTDPTAPTLLGQYHTERPTHHQIEVRGTIAYLKAFGLDVIDVSDPSSPTLITNYPVDGNFNALAVHGTIAYIANGEIEGIQIVDFSNPASPVLLGIFSAAGYARGIEIVNNKAYILKSNALLILDVSIPESPALLGTYKTDRYFGQKLAVDGTTVYLEHSPSSYTYELAVIDASDPASPQLITTKPMAQNILAIDIKNHKAYISVAWVGMIILDLTNPSDPIQIGSYHHGGAAIDVVNDTAYIAMGNVGLQIVDVSDCPPCPADLNDDGFTDFLDISAFLTAYTNSDPLADLNNDGQTDFLDISAFLDSYSNGCP